MLPFAPSEGILTIEELSKRVAAIEKVLYASVEQAAGLQSSTTVNGVPVVVEVGGSPAPTTGQVLTATGPAVAEWQTVVIPTPPPEGAAADVFSLRKLGTATLEACAGDDARLTNTRVPTAHAASHLRGYWTDVNNPYVTVGNGTDVLPVPTLYNAGLVPSLLADGQGGINGNWVLSSDGTWKDPMNW